MFESARLLDSFSKFLVFAVSLLSLATLPAAEPIVQFSEAIKKGDLKIVEKMLAEGVDPNIRVPGSGMNFTPLFLAVESSDPLITNALLKAGADATMEDGNGDPVMVYASSHDRVEHAKVLIRHGVSIDSKNRRGITALMRGAPYEKGPDIQAVLDLGANPELTDPEGNTALMIASEAANLEAMKVLINAGARIDVSNRRDETALTFALVGSSPYSHIKGAKKTDLVKLLIEAGADINRRNTKGQSVLILALDSWDVGQEAIDALLAAKPEISVQDEDGRDALHYAVLEMKRNIHIARLLELGADPKTVDKEGNTLLMRAAANLRLDLVREFISRGLSATDKNQAGKTALHFATWAGESDDGNSKDVVELLHKHGAILTAVDLEGDTPLHFAAAAGNPAVVSYLLPHYPDVAIQNSSDETPLHFAAGYGKTEIVKLLLPGFNNIEQRDARGHTALMNAIEGDHRPTILALLKAGAEINTKDNDGKPPLLAAITANQIDKARFLLRHGADPKSMGHTGDELLRAARMFHDKLISPENHAFLIKLFADLTPDIDHLDAEGITALMWVAASNNESALRSLLDRGPKLDVRSEEGRTALMWAACSRALDSMRILITAGADESLRDPTGRSASAWLDWTSAEHPPASPQLMDQTPLGERIILSRQIALQEYLKQGTWRKDDLVAGVPPLHLAAGLGEIGAISTLMERGAPPNSTMVGGSTPLMEAATNGQLKAVEFLLENGADPTLRDLNRNRAVDSAVDFGHVEVARLFLQRKIAFSDDESALLSLLIYRGDDALLREFLEAGAAIFPRNPKVKKDGDPFKYESLESAVLLIAAGIQRDPQILRVLMEFPLATGADDPNNFVYALHHAAARGRLENVKFLIEELKVDLDVLLGDSFGGVFTLDSSDSDKQGPQAVKGFSALSRALEEGHPEVVRYLVEQGATITGRTRGGALPLTFVIAHRQDELLRFLLENEAPLELVDLNGQTALHHAAASNHKLAVRLLLKQGADPEAKTRDGLTALDLARKKDAKKVIALLEAESK